MSSLFINIVIKNISFQSINYIDLVHVQHSFKETENNDNYTVCYYLLL